MAGPRFLPKGFNYWPEVSPQLKTTQDIVDAYEKKKLAGVYFEPEERDALIQENRAITGFGSLEEAAGAMNWADSGAGKLIVPFVHIIEAYPGCYPGPAQEVGDCVSHSQKNAGLGTMVCEVVAGKPDSETGLVEGFPEVSETGIKNGVLSSEAIYWWRRSSGHGWYCAAACRVTQKESGLWIRKDYPELGIDLEKYSGRNTEIYGRNPPQGKIAAEGTQHLIRAFAQTKSREGRRDALHNGYFLTTCGSESFSNKRDQNGLSERTREGWAHAMAEWGFDDRPVVHRIYGDSLELIPNSWGVWNGGPRDIIESAQLVPPSKKELWIALDLVNPTTGNLMIPKGSFWARSRDVANREAFAMSSVNGFPRKKLDVLYTSLAG